MDDRLIEAALQEAKDTQNVNIGGGALASVSGVLREVFGGSPAVVVADGNTFQVAGKEVRRQLERAGHTMMEPYVFPAEPPLYAEYSNIEALHASWPTREAMERSVREQHTVPDLERGAVEQTLAKYISAGELAQRLELLRDLWPGLREKVRVQLMPAEQISEKLQAAGCPTGPVEIGLSWEDFEATYLRARTIRKRYTILDLAFETGILEECVDELFAPEGFWGRAAASHARADGTRAVGSFRRSEEA
jgi:glycerol dehydrogenase-like iron-containing ADH family enzyme